ncbi:hypothetical protein H9Y05_05735 [Crocinitomicaceae bacterium CZZ-1]|uniref:Uncharacterized protein n=1 Tax=Taishania pollutisoli TaxID=2766479 RepID=A0A8J6PE12_9FLAO|nr:hypothetical protein [Taishania pollutisoli]MBC9811975.1 hypothetical protein [Taishania pollutisoli]NGF74868.1 hypothetical protein [Fluviicola sp. SGL-29]
MEHIPVELVDLLESLSFDALSQKQRQLVLNQMTEEEYRAHQKIILEATELDYAIPEVAPLIMPKPSQPFWKKPIPLWQAVSSVAAVLLLFFFLPRDSEAPVTISKTSPAIQFVHDTVVKQLPADTVFTVATRWIIDTVYIGSTLVQELPQRILEAPNNLYIPLKDAFSGISSVSLKEEKNRISIPEAIRVEL